LADDDCYTVENAVWSIGEIGTNDPKILAEITQLLAKPQQSYRVIIHTLTKLDYQPAVEEIRKFTTSEDGPIASAAIAALGRFAKDYSQIEKVLAFLQHPQVLAVATRNHNRLGPQSSRFWDQINCNYPVV
jgi:bilin biosynthesis protein